MHPGLSAYIPYSARKRSTNTTKPTTRSYSQRPNHMCVFGVLLSHSASLHTLRWTFLANQPGSHKEEGRSHRSYFITCSPHFAPAINYACGAHTTWTTRREKQKYTLANGYTRKWTNFSHETYRQTDRLMMHCCNAKDLKKDGVKYKGTLL